MANLAAEPVRSRIRLSMETRVALIALLLLLLIRSAHSFNPPLYDFAEYWSAGRLLLVGDNPYDVTRIGELERQVGRDSEPLLMWNPPWVLPLVLPFGALPARASHWLWQLLTLALVLGAADVAWREYGGPAERRGVAWLLAVSFIPTFLTIYLGQISAVLLAGVALFLRFERRRQDLPAGAATFLLAVKPHLFLLFWIALGLWIVHHRRWRILAGGVLAGAGATLLAVAFDPAVLSQYFRMITSTPPVQYHSPTVGTVLRLLLGEDRFGLQFVAPIAGIAWFLPWWSRQAHRGDWSELISPLLFASLLTSPYGAWPFDLTVLLVPLMQVAANMAKVDAPVRAPIFLYFAANALAAVFVVRRVDFLWWIWLAPALLLAYGIGRKQERSASAPVALLTNDNA